jgi:thioredoxin reductase
MYDVFIAGGGPAGLSAAVVLGRCRRRVLVCDHGQPRNAASRGMHGYLTRDGILPSDFLELARKEVLHYGVEFRSCEATGIAGEDGRFDVELADGKHIRCRKVLIATGVVDRLPAIEGIDDLYGCSVFHCPYCDGWEMRDQPLAVYGKGQKAAGLAIALKTTWSADIVLCSDGGSGLKALARAELEQHQIPVRQEKIARLEGSEGRLERIVFKNGEMLERRGLFFYTGQGQHSELARRLGCEFNEKGTIKTNLLQETNVPGVYIAGDASHDVQFVIVAAAEGAKAGVAINKALQMKERQYSR